jgi:hypothetical protein
MRCETPHPPTLRRPSHLPSPHARTNRPLSGLVHSSCLLGQKCCAMCLGGQPWPCTASFVHPNVGLCQSLELVVASACAPTPPHRPRAPHPPACITVFRLTNTLSFSRLLRALPLPSYGEGEGGNGAGAAAVNAASSDGRTSPGKAGVAAHSATIDDPSLFVSRPMEETSVDQSDITHSTHSAHLDLTKW